MWRLSGFGVALHRFIGNRVKVKVVKNKMAPPFRECQFDIIYGEGISREGDLVDCGLDAGIVEKTGTWYSYKGERLGQGRENVKRLLQENKELAAQLEEEIRRKVGLLPVEKSPEKTQQKPAEKSEEKPEEKEPDKETEKPAEK